MPWPLIISGVLVALTRTHPERPGWHPAELHGIDRHHFGPWIAQPRQCGTGSEALPGRQPGTPHQRDLPPAKAFEGRLVPRPDRLQLGLVVETYFS
jgi:hypothetical protein